MVAGGAILIDAYIYNNEFVTYYSGWVIAYSLIL